ncbi:MAG: 50S ribosomal protein L4 [Nitrospirota bacterium]
MPAVDIIDAKNQKTGKVDLSDDVFGVNVNSGLIHEAFLMQRANARQGNAETKTRHFVSGGGVKPYRQKGTGRARAGSSRSGLWRHGGIIFGPHPRDYSYSMPKKAARQALSAVLSEKLLDGELFIMDKLTVAEPKTKAAAELLSSLGLTGTTLILTAGADRNIYLAARNIPSVKVCRVENVNIYDLLKYKNLLSDKESLEKLQEALS